jgi:hypothetical protein
MQINITKQDSSLIVRRCLKNFELYNSLQDGRKIREVDVQVFVDIGGFVTSEVDAAGLAWMLRR